MKKRRQTVDYVVASPILRLLYDTKIGRVVLKVLTKPVISKMVGLFLDSPFSTFLISDMVKKNGIVLSDYEKKRYKSFNDFFTRKIKPNKRIIDMNKDSLISPCDSKLSVYNIEEKSIFKIKDSYYTVSDLLDGDEIAKEYDGGLCMIFRLCVDDYHRYCYIDDGYEVAYRRIDGELHTVQPIALDKYNVYKRNSREYTILKTKNFGKVVQVEVGALFVGKISNEHKGRYFRKGQEKGKFEFGGSTIVLLMKKDVVDIDEDIIVNTKNGKETIVKVGEKIGTVKEKI